MEKISDYTAATSMNGADLLEKSETNSPSPGFTSKSITWANFVLAIKATLSYLIGDGSVSVINNLAVYNDTAGLHIKDSGISMPGIYKATVIGGSNVFAFAADSMIKEISILFVSGNLSLKIGTTAGAGDLLDTTIVTEDINLTNKNYYCVGAQNIYVTTTGIGSFKLRIDFINKQYN